MCLPIEAGSFCASGQAHLVSRAPLTHRRRPLPRHRPGIWCRQTSMAQVFQKSGIQWQMCIAASVYSTRRWPHTCTGHDDEGALSCPRHPLHLGHM